MKYSEKLMELYSNPKNVGSLDETDKNVKYLCRERYSGGCSRSFYVGEEITQQDIKARFENGVLTFIVPKIDKTKRQQGRIRDSFQ